jgi:hypothetical protein
MASCLSPASPGNSASRYFEDCGEVEVVEQIDGIHGVMAYALDPDAARRLWDVSSELLSSARTAA